jgi:hypothetical protein
MNNKDLYWNRNAKDFYENQRNIRDEILRDQKAREDLKISELDLYKRGVIDLAKKEVEEYERTHGQSGNFFTDFKYGLSSANKMFLKPFNKYVAPVLSMAGPVGQSIASTTSTVSGIVDKLE